MAEKPDEQLLEDFLKGLNLRSPTKDAYDPGRYQHKNQSEINTLFSDLKEEKMEGLKESIQDIENQIEQRNMLHEEILKDHQKVELEISAIISSLSPNPNLRDNPELLRVRAELQKKIIEVKEMTAREKLDKFRDIAELKKELRERLAEFRERASQTHAFEKIME